MLQQDCENCDEGLTATHHCYECDINYCESCSTAIHKSKAFRLHEVVSVEEYRVYCDQTIPTDEDHHQDLKNVFIYVDHDRHSLETGRRFYTLDEIQGDELMPVVSFVGPTGVGKSTLMRLLCKGGCDKPISSDPKSLESTSADIHAYIGCFPTLRNPSTALMLDCEGINGTAPRSRFNLAKEKMQEFLNIRKPFVNSAFPRLLYMFSSVFCFMFNGSPKEQQTWADLISTYASQAAAATINQLVLPVLIVVFNKVTVEEGVWDVEEASAKFQDIGVLQSLFREVKVVYIPDRKAACRQYVTQVQALQHLIAGSIDKQKICTKRAVMQLFSISLPEFSQNHEATFNFMDVAIRNQPLPQDYPAYLQEFFLCVYKKELELGLTNQKAYDQAAERLSERMLDSFHHHLVRSNIAISLETPEELKHAIGQVETMIKQYLPCTATHSFPVVDQVSCESSARNHGEVHQSSRTYKTEVPKEGFFGRLFGLKTVATQSCRWEGEMQLPKKYNTTGWLVSSSTPKAPSMVDAATFIPEHKKLLGAQQNILHQLKTDRLCLACLLGTPTEFLLCKHTLCLACCKELLAGGIIECPFCNKIGEWSQVYVPRGAGFRILTIDGGGVRGIVSAIILEQIEKRLDIPLHQLFDLIVGTSVGGLNAIGFGVLQLQGQRMINAFAQLEHAFRERNFLGSTFLGWFYYGYKYNREPMHNTLASIYPKTRLLGSTQSPRVAVVACEVTEGQPRTVLFTSYNSSNDLVRREIRGTILDAVEATTAAGTYFPVFVAKYGSFTDGGILCNNPCDLGYEEAKHLWEDKSLDFLLSVGTGKWEEKHALTDSLFAFLKLAVKVAANSYMAWERLQYDLKKSGLEGNAHRLDPSLDREYTMDDFRKMASLEQQANNYIQENTEEFNLVCNTLLAKLFYLVPPTSPPKGDCLLALRVRTRVPQAEAVAASSAFTIKVKIGGKEQRNVARIVTVEDTLYVEITGMIERGDIEVYVLCHIGYDATIMDQGIPIAGCPLKIARRSSSLDV